ncbi:MAG TPA: hypothetical protein VJB14_04305 [Planctomycetota bacterium]|nr:hypothetical protein [Planctomycetota bacterium]
MSMSRRPSHGKNAGVSLVEVMVASVILVAVVTISMSILFSSTRMASRATLTSDLEERGRKFTDFCKEEFLQAKFTGQITLSGSGATNLGIDPNAYSTSIAYQMPGNVDAAGTSLGNGNVVFGYTSPFTGARGFRQTLACFIRFEADTVFKESSSAPAATQLADWGAPFPAYPALPAATVLNMDVNKDGDRTDTFVRGKVRKYVFAPFDGANPVYTANGNQCLLGKEILSDQVILRVNPSATGRFNWNVDSDASSPASQLDPLFLFVDQDGPDGVVITNANVVSQGKGMAVTIWHGNYEDDRKGFAIRKNSVTVRFRNTQ